MANETVELEIPSNLYMALQSLRQDDRETVIEIIARLINIAQQTDIESEKRQAERRLIQQALVEAGLSLPPSEVKPSSKPLSADERERLAHRFATDEPIANLIIEERSER